MNKCRCLNCITPPHILHKLLENEDPDIRDIAMNTLLSTAHLRGERSIRAISGFMAAPAQGRRTIYDCRRSTQLSSSLLARSENGAKSADDTVNRAFEGLGATRDFFDKIFKRNSIDDQGMRLDGYVHRGVRYNNAFWDGQEMVFGDGDGKIFSDFTLSLDVIAHELTHGVTEFSANLEYHNQSGALNESISDVFGSLVKQWSLGQKASVADWLIGSELFTPGIKADSLRSMKSPGTAYDNALLGRDPQPDHMDKYVRLPDTEQGDYGGVHINSGIPNKAFYLTAIDLGGYAWDAAGHIWYAALLASTSTTDFQDFANTTFLKAGQFYGNGSNEQQAVLGAWDEVGVRIARNLKVIKSKREKDNEDTESDTALNKQIQTLAKQIKSLAKDVEELKNRK